MPTSFPSSAAKSRRRGVDSGDRKMSSPPQPPELPEDLICGSILPRLPVRSLLRFATVCKAWRDLILGSAAFAALQAQSPSPASVALARFHNGRLEFLGGPRDAHVAPPDPSVEFLSAAAGIQQRNLQLCASAAGLLCLTVAGAFFLVCNPTTGRFGRIWYSNCPRGVAALAYDPAAAARGYDVVVAATQGTRTCRFFRFSSRTARSGWRAVAGANATVRLSLFEEILPKAACAAGRRVHWLTSRGNVVWHDADADLSGTLPPPPGPSGGGRLEGSMDLAAWNGRLRLACASSAGIGVWELASYGGGGSAARWDAVHQRKWNAVPGVVAAARCSMWSVVPAGMEAGGEEAVGLAVRYGGMEKDVWYRALVRYDTGTGATAAAVELAGMEVHDDFGTVFGYHLSLAALPRAP